MEWNGMEWNGTECLDSRLLCLAVEHPRLPQSAPWSGAEVIPEKARTLRPLMAIPSTSLPLSWTAYKVQLRCDAGVYP